MLVVPNVAVMGPTEDYPVLAITVRQAVNASPPLIPHLGCRVGTVARELQRSEQHRASGNGRRHGQGVLQPGGRGQPALHGSSNDGDRFLVGTGDAKAVDQRPFDDDTRRPTCWMYIGRRQLPASMQDDALLGRPKDPTGGHRQMNLPRWLVHRIRQPQRCRMAGHSTFTAVQQG
jgi:hypothetical protein